MSLWQRSSASNRNVAAEGLQAEGTRAATVQHAAEVAAGATVPLNGKLARLALSIGNPWNPSSLVLAGMIPVILGQSGLSYDPLLGVIGQEAHPLGTS